MTRRASAPSFTARPSAAEAWVRTPDPQPITKEAFTARLTIDITPALRGRIKIAAFGRGETVADMLRALLDREFADGADEGSAS